jgi:hypothetical protein
VESGAWGCFPGSFWLRLSDLAALDAVWPVRLLPILLNLPACEFFSFARP